MDGPKEARCEPCYDSITIGVIANACRIGTKDLDCDGLMESAFNQCVTDDGPAPDRRTCNQGVEGFASAVLKHLQDPDLANDIDEALKVRRGE